MDFTYRRLRAATAGSDPFLVTLNSMRQCLVFLCVASLFAADSSQWEEKFRAIPSPQNLRDYMQRLSARPHHVGSPYDKDNAEWIAAKLKSWGLDAKIENFDVLFPTPKDRLVEMVEPTKFTAKLQEPPLAVDPTSDQQSEQLPVYHAYSIDGEATAPLVYVNYGIPADYEQLARMGISVNGAIVIARYGESWRGIKPKVAAEHGALACIVYSDPRDDGYSVNDVFPEGPDRPRDGAQRGSVMDMPLYPGDPLTPGVGAVPDAKRLPISEAKTLTKIPVLPMSYGDAQPLLAALKGPVAPEAWRGGAAHHVSRRTGPGQGSHAREIQLGYQAALRRDRAHSRLRISRRMDHPRQSSRRVGQRRGRSCFRRGRRDGRNARPLRIAEARLEAEADHHLLLLGWRRTRAARFHGMGRDACRRSAEARRRLHQLAMATAADF